jgi:hypothetical protein
MRFDKKALQFAIRGVNSLNMFFRFLPGSIRAMICLTVGFLLSGVLPVLIS